MHDSKPPIPENEMQRLLSLADLDIDYSSMEDNFKDLTQLAAKVAGTEISLINIIDSYTQWTIANYGLQSGQVAREETACQYTIMKPEPFEVPDLAADDRFKDKPYVSGAPGLRYYFGLPLKTSEGVHIGALCVLDTSLKKLSPEKIEMLEIIGQTVVKRLRSYEALNSLSQRLKAANESKMKVAHDIRGPLTGIIGLSDMITDQGDACDIQELMEFVSMINKSGKSLLELADEILTADSQKPTASHEFNLLLFKVKLIQLYAPQAKYKDISLNIDINSTNRQVPFSKNKLIQITGNLISNAIKFTAAGGTVVVGLDLMVTGGERVLKIIVSDNGVGMEALALEQVTSGNTSSSAGTLGEKGFGFGLSLVSHLVESLNGHLDVLSNPGQGSRFEVLLPQK
jgi:signal transduction histidine kinase